MAGTKKDYQALVKRWHGRGYEKGETAQFWIDLLETMGYQHHDGLLFEHHLPSGGFIDVWLRDASCIVEQKALGVDLDKPEIRQGVPKTPLEQALDYVDELPRPEQARYVVTCNFGTFRVYDRDRCSRSQLASNAFEFGLDELAEHPEYLAFLADPSNSRLEREKQVSIRAGELIGRLYDRMQAGYIDPDSEESMHALNVLCVRLVFCLYCEDADLFPKDAFLNYLRDVNPADVRERLKRLFRALDTPISERDPYDTAVRPFPYVNGGLFRDQTEVPNFDAEMKRFLLEEVSAAVDWSQISPTIFGGIFESTLNPETRRSGGMHYTSPENIHKVIDPLFLDGLKAEFVAIRDGEGLTPRQRKNRYAALHNKLCSLTFFDPACGSGNFLTETYISLRKLEDALLHELRGGQTGLGFEDEGMGQRVSLNQFYGIEINDFAVTVAETALWISRLKANGETSMLLSMGDDDFPLHESAHIVHGNALRMDWNEVLPASECSFIMGNPPFLGARTMNGEQKTELQAIAADVRNNYDIDYVGGWYIKSADMMDANSSIHAALVSTNSICQGAQPGDLWKYLIDERNLAIEFAHRTFIWDSEASDKAHVHCVIIGFAKSQVATRDKTVFENGVPEKAANINGYLLDAPNVFVQDRKTPLCDVPVMANGNQPRDGGNLLMTEEERAEALAAEPELARFIRPYIGADEFIKGKVRYCLWLNDASDDEIQSSDILRTRVRAVYEFRMASKAKTTNGYAKTPHLMAQRPQRQGVDFLIMPMTSGDRRFYMPIGYMDKTVVANNNAFVVCGTGLYHFGILTSQIHNAWIRVVAGRLGSSYRYSKEIAYNCFPWPDPTPEQRRRIESCAQAVLDARAAHEGDSLAQMYDGISPMPEYASKSDLKKYDQRKYDDLLAAHKALDAAVEAAYGVDFGGDEEKIVAHLFKLYARATHNE